MSRTNRRGRVSPTQRAAQLLRERDPHAGETPAQRLQRITAMSAIVQAARAARIPLVDVDELGGEVIPPWSS